MKRITNLHNFKNTLPYASEIFGVYQPLLGWKSKRTARRVDKGFITYEKSILSKLAEKFRGKYLARFGADCQMEIETLEPAAMLDGFNFAGILMRAVASRLPPLSGYDERVWENVLQPDSLQDVLNTQVREQVTLRYRELCEQFSHPGQSLADVAEQTARQLLEAESQTAGVLLYLKDSKAYEELKRVFYESDLTRPGIELLTERLGLTDPFETMDPKRDLNRVGLSPMGIVHLFRQYFFELDTFLGSPVGHVWVSPGSTVELAEVNTRKTTVERLTETAQEIIVRSEKGLLVRDELSEAVKQENRNDTKVGASVNASQSYGVVNANESASFDYTTTQQAAREQTHKQMREQTEKLSTEMKQSFKTTFKIVTETTETSSKRYVLTNSTSKLLNYELRRKMRQVGVQVQDIGTYLCWQTYVDDPAAYLGVANFVHIGEPPDLAKIPQPEKVLPPPAFDDPLTISIPFRGDGSASNDDTFDHGGESSLGTGDRKNYIDANIQFGPVQCRQADFRLASVRV
ncbi:MAG: peptidoglycan-binding protein, partial [Acidobacteriota bacterium]